MEEDGVMYFVVVVHFNGVRLRLWTVATNRPIVHPPDVWSPSGLILTEEKPNNSEKNLSHCHFVHYKSHMDSPGGDFGPPQWESGD
jgi:hypothetical protein